MSRKKSELQDKIEELEAELERLDRCNKALMRRLKKLDNKFDEDEYLREDQIQRKYEKLNEYVCPYCKKKTMEEIKILNRTFRKCENCGKRTKAEKA